MVRAAAENPTYKLDRLDVQICAMMAEMGLWTNTAIGKTFGIHRSAVLKHRKRYYPTATEGETSA